MLAPVGVVGEIEDVLPRGGQVGADGDPRCLTGMVWPSDWTTCLTGFIAARTGRVLAGPHHNRRDLLRGAFLAALGAVLVGLPDAASAQSERQGFYAGLQLGVANATPVNSSLSGINHPTRCDVLLYPRSVRPPVDDPACLNTVPAVIASNEFDHGRGLASGVMVGYAAGRVRLEVDYLHRYLGDNTSPLGDTVSAALQGKGSEWSSEQPPHEWIGDYAATSSSPTRTTTFATPRTGRRTSVPALAWPPRN